MKKRSTVSVIVTVLLLVSAAFLIGFCLYGIIVEKEPITDYLPSFVGAICGSITAVISVNRGRRQSLDMLERAYEKDIGDAFSQRPLWRKKLLCAIAEESRTNTAVTYGFSA